MRDLLNDPKFAEAACLFVRQCAISRLHDQCVRVALEKYGDHGPQISGVIRDHFPADVKDHLRQLCRQMNEAGNAAWTARPKYVRNSTMRELATQVATRDGSGFYGPQPRR